MKSTSPMKEGIVIGALFLFASIVVYGQTAVPPPDYLPKVVPPTPNASRITEYYAQRPNMYTGTANVSVPLYTIDFDGWKLPLSISYNATGIRTNEEASEVGLGWALSATGVISRSINGGDDFNPGGLQGGKGYVVADEALRQFDLGFDDTSGGNLLRDYDTSYYLKLSRQKLDTQPDVFNYNFFGYSGSFALTQQVRGPVKAIKITQDPCLIEFDLDTKVFTVTTPQGFKGTFSVKERSTTATGNGRQILPEHRLDCCTAAYVDYEYLKNSSGQFRVITSWYLSKIRSPRGKEINFTYDMSNGRSFNVSKTRSFAEVPDEGPLDRICIQTIQEHVYLESIISDEVELEFTMETRDDLRINDLFTDTALTEVNFPVGSKLKRYKTISIQGLTSGSTLNKTIEFVQSYFNLEYYSPSADTEGEKDNLRSRLDHLKIDDQKYSFIYEQPSGLPNKLTTAMDHFGFYNGKGEADDLLLLPPQQMANMGDTPTGTMADTAAVAYYTTREGREVDVDYGKAGIMKKIVYPTGGYSVFSYEAHRYIPDNVTYYKELTEGIAGNYGGGTRIRLIEDYDYSNDSVPARSKEYIYTEDYNALPVNTTTSGRLMTPLYNRYARVFGDTINHTIGYQFRYRTHTGIPGSQSAQGKIIGYSKVHEIVKGDSSSYRNTYTFENNTNVVSAFNAIATGTPNLNGQMKTSIYYDSSGTAVQAVINSDYNHVESDKVRGLLHEPFGGDDAIYLTYHIPYNLDRTFITPYVVRTITSATPSEIEQVNDVIGDIGNSTEVITTSTYNDSTWLLKTQEITNSLGEVVKTEYKRPFDYLTPSSILTFMKGNSVHVTEPVIEEIVTRDGTVVSAKASEYSMDTTSGTFVNLKRSYLWNSKLGAFTSSSNGSSFPSPYELKVTFDKFNEDGKILQYTASNGITNSFVWGYDNTLPIVQGLNVKYSTLKSAHDASAGFYYDSLIRNQSGTKGKQITTFTHDPLVGIKTIVTPWQDTTTYIYDDFQRLKMIVDNDGKTLEEYEYNYRTVPPPDYNAIATSVSSLSWGTQIPAAFGDILIGGNYYSNCASRERSVTLANNSTVDVIVEMDMHLAGGAYSTEFGGAILASGSSIVVDVEFNHNNNLIVDTYEGQMIFSLKDVDTHESVGLRYVDLYAELANPSCPALVDTINWGTVSSSTNRPVEYHPPSDGNIGYRLVSYTFRDGNNQSYTPTDFNVSTAFINPTDCILPGSGPSSPTVLVNYHPQTQSVSPQSTTLRFETTHGCGDLNVTLIGWNRGGTYYKHISVDIVEPLPLTLIDEDSLTTVVRLTNDGEMMLDIQDITPDVVDAAFWISDTEFILQPGEYKDITVSFKPETGDIDLHQITYTITAALLSGEYFRGDTEFLIYARRLPIYSIADVPGSVVIKPNTGPVSVNITNNGNVEVEVVGVALDRFQGDTNFTLELQTVGGTPVSFPSLNSPLVIPAGETVVARLSATSSNYTLGQCYLNILLGNETRKEVAVVKNNTTN